MAVISADAVDRSGSATARKDNSMIEVLPDMPANVMGFRVSGRLLGDDLREFKPTMERLLDKGEIRIVEVIASDYQGFGPGGLAEDLKLGFGTLLQHHSAFKRIAVVSDKEWVAHTLHALAWMVPGELAIFGLDELDRAKEWAAS
jgi:hypothetical protein